MSSMLHLLVPAFCLFVWNCVASSYRLVQLLGIINIAGIVRIASNSPVMQVHVNFPPLKARGFSDGAGGVRDIDAQRNTSPN
eukprot:6489468-Amphidinium_carterae.1